MTNSQLLLREFRRTGSKEESILQAILDARIEEGCPIATELVEVQDKINKAGPEYHCTQFMYSCGENLSELKDLKRFGCPACSKWANLNMRFYWLELQLANWADKEGGEEHDPD